MSQLHFSDYIFLLFYHPADIAPASYVFLRPEDPSIIRYVDNVKTKFNIFKIHGEVLAKQATIERFSTDLQGFEEYCTDLLESESYSLQFALPFTPTADQYSSFYKEIYTLWLTSLIAAFANFLSLVPVSIDSIDSDFILMRDDSSCVVLGKSNPIQPLVVDDPSLARAIAASDPSQMVLIK